MKIIFITVSLPYGNGEEFFIPEMREWARRGHEILIVPRSPRGRINQVEADFLQSTSLHRSICSWDMLISFFIQLIRHPFKFLRTIRLISTSSQGIKVFLKNLFVLPKSIWLSEVATGWRADHIHAYWASTVATMALAASEWSGIPWSFSAHRGDIVGANLLRSKTVKARFTRYISENSLKMAHSFGAHIHQEKAIVIHIGVDVPFTKAIVKRENVSSIILLCPANLSSVKGHEYLIRAMAILKQKGTDCSLRLAGEGPLRGKLNRLVDDLSLGTMVDFLGHVPHANLLDWYRLGAINIVILPSVDLGNNEHEGIPVSLMEAMSYGIPVISTATGAIPELLHGGAGILTPPKDPMALAAAIERVINDDDLRSNLILTGRKRIEEKFNVETGVNNLVLLMSGRPIPTAHSNLVCSYR